jgi:hypothetical protein
MNMKVFPLLAALLLSASAAFAVEVVITPDPFVPNQYLGRFDESFVESGLHIPTWEFVSPVDGTLTFTLQASGPVQFIGYQFDHGPVTGFFTFTGHDPFVTGIPVDAGPHSLLVGYQAAPQLPPRMPATGGFTGQITIEALAPVPEPQTWLVLLAGLLAIGFMRRTWGRRPRELFAARATGRDRPLRV